MPGSLLGLSSKVRRSESGRSDRSDISAYSADSRNSGKKVSFNKAVRVKKYPRRTDSVTGDDGHLNDVSPEKRFWFKVYKNRHPNQDTYDSKKKYDGTHEVLLSNGNHSDRDENGYGKLDPIAESEGPRSLPNVKYTSEIGVGTSSYDKSFVLPKHSSQKQVDPIPVRPNHVKKIVNKFNDEAVIKLHKDDDTDEDEQVRHTYTHSLPPTGLSNGHRHPPEPPVDYIDGTNEGKPQTKSRKNPLVNGVKVIFGMAQLKKRDDKLKNEVLNKNMMNIKKSQGTSTRERPPSNGYVGPYKTSIVLPEHSRDSKTKEKGKNSTLSRRSKTSYKSSELNNNTIDKKVSTVDQNRHHVTSSIRPVEVWNSGDQLISDSSRFESSTDKIADGQLFRSVGEQSRTWRNEKRTVYEEEIAPVTLTFDRRAKSYGDLRAGENGERRFQALGNGKVLSSDELYHNPEKYNSNNNKESRVKTLNYHYGPMKDKGTQCNRIVDKSEDSSDTEKYRVIKSRDGYVSAFSDVPTLDRHRQKPKASSTMTASTIKSNGGLNSEVIYSQVDKSKKKKKFGASLTSTSTPRTESPSSKISRGQPSIITDSVRSGSDGKTDSKIKSSQKSFGFRLKKAFGGEKDKGNTYTSAYDEDDDNWYDVDADVAAAEKRGKKGQQQLESRQEIDEEFSSVSENGSEKRNAPPASVIREMDPKKREISYENVPHPGAGHSREVSASGMWFRNADEDYRREMAQSDVSYPSGSHVGSNEVGSSATLSRLHEKRGTRDESVPVKSYTLDRRDMNGEKSKKDKTDKTPVKILVNGHEIDDTDELSDGYTPRSRHKPHHNRSTDDIRLPSSVQSDPVYHRGGLAAAYKARQKAALKRSNSTATNSVFGSHLSVNSPMRSRLHHHNSSGGSMVSSSDSDSTRRRRTLVMYIPGVNHPERRASDDEKMPSISRTQSMHIHAKPTRYQKNSKMGSQSRLAGKSNTDLSEAAHSEEADTITPLRSELKKKPRSPGNSLGRSSRKDLRRRNSIPKDTKFGWFKWKIKGKPSKEP